MTDQPASVTKNQSALMDAVAKHLSPIIKNPDRNKFANTNILKTLTRNTGIKIENVEPIEIEEEEIRQSEIIKNYLALSSLKISFDQCEYYFRRYPFQKLPVSHSEHLRNICEMYFDRIEQFRDRLKHFMNSIRVYSGDRDPRYGILIREYGKFFRV